MRHQYKKTMELDTGVQKKSNVVRSLLTSLIEHGQIITTPQRAKVLKSEIDKLISKLISFYDKYEDEKSVKREAARVAKSVIWTEKEGKKLVSELMPKYKKEGKTSGFVSDYKLGFRQGDSTEKVLVRLV